MFEQALARYRELRIAGRAHEEAETQAVHEATRGDLKAYIAVRAELRGALRNER
jgi:hypothetical protein